MKDNNDIFEVLAENKKRREAIQRMLDNIDTDYPYLMFGKKKAEIGDFYNADKKKQGAVAVIDLPEDLGLKQLILAGLISERTRLENEFNSYTIKK